MPTEYEKGAKYISNNTHNSTTPDKKPKASTKNIVDIKSKKKYYATIANNF